MVEVDATMKNPMSLGRTGNSLLDDPAIDSAVRIRCEKCARDTTHSVYSEYIQAAMPEEDEFSEQNSEQLLFVWTKLQILGCSTCGRPIFRQGRTSTPQLAGTWAWRIYFNPKAQSPSLTARHLPSKVGKLYCETWQAFDCGAYTLAAVGMRAVVEAVCIDRNCKGADLQQKISRLKGVLSAEQIRHLQTHRAIGNAAVHQMETPSFAELGAAIDVLEHLLKTLYELPQRAEEFKRLRRERLSSYADCLLEAC
jgi:hypothetical protein